MITELELCQRRCVVMFLDACALFPNFEAWLGAEEYDMMREVQSLPRGECQRERCGCQRAPLITEVVDGESISVCAWKNGCDI